MPEDLKVTPDTIGEEDSPETMSIENAVDLDVETDADTEDALVASLTSTLDEADIGTVVAPLLVATTGDTVGSILHPEGVMLVPTTGITNTGGLSNFTFVTAESPEPDLAPADTTGDQTVDSALPERWVSRIVVEGLVTTDGRQIAEGALTWRDLPLPIMAQFQQPEFGGHALSVVAGKMETITRQGNELIATGTFDVGHDDGQMAAEMVRDQTLRFVSIDSEVIAAEFIPLDAGCNPDQEYCDGYWSITEGRIMGVSIVPFSAFPQAVIVPEGVDLPIVEPYGTDVAGNIVASACSCESQAGNWPLHPEASWFENPDLDDLTHFTVTPEGRVYGHIAGWKVAHIGFDGMRVHAPHSARDYTDYMTGAVETEEGTKVAVGRVSLGSGHADLRLNAKNTVAHYDDTSTLVAFISVGEDEHGIWCAGVLAPGATEAQRVTLNATDVSGDWRGIAGHREMIHVLAVNRGGFTTPANLRVANFAIRMDDDGGALVGAGMIPLPKPGKLVQDRLDKIEATLELMLPMAVEALVARVSVPSL